MPGYINEMLDKFRVAAQNAMFAYAKQCGSEHSVDEDRARNFWNERWTHGGALNMKSLFIEDIHTVDTEGRRSGCAEVREGMMFTITPEGVRILAEESAAMMESDAEPAEKYRAQMCVSMVRLLLKSYGQFVVARMAYDPEGLVDYPWLALYGDCLGMGKVDDDELEDDDSMTVVEKMIERCADGGILDTQFRPGFLMWDFLKPLAENNLMRPLMVINFE